MKNRDIKDILNQLEKDLKKENKIKNINIIKNMLNSVKKELKTEKSYTKDNFNYDIYGDNNVLSILLFNDNDYMLNIDYEKK